MTSTWKTICTIGQIAHRLNEPIHRIEYAIKTRGIEPTAIAGNARIFQEEDIERVATALRDIDSKRREGGAQCTF